ncbi:MAG: hypothetical protein AAFQ45_12895 [Pseudomonadota bacterium]
MNIRLLIVSLAWTVMLMVTFANVMRPFTGMVDLALWVAYLVVLTGIILWPRSEAGKRVEQASGAGWQR